MSADPDNDRATAGLEDTWQPAGEHDPRPALEPPVPQAIGPYQFMELIGEGGMGEVWLAEQSGPIRRRVAIKVIKAGMDTKQVVARFESERQALALMDHPAIAKVIDGGSTSEGRPYFVMEYVPGIPITEHCDEGKLSTPQRLELFAQVCEGVQHAHQKAIIHRDLKPSNILVTLVDGRPCPKIIDFGIAKATGQRLTDKTLLTEVGAVIGTPEYMSPEQADLTAQDVDTRTDVYSLGVVLYQLLTGELPFGSAELRSSNEEMRRRLREVEPPKPSTKLKTLGEGATGTAQQRNTDPATLRRLLEGDLDAITMKAMEKERSRRYGTATELAADIGRHLRNEPVLARPPSTRYRLQKYVRRHRLGVSLAAGLFLLLAGVSTTLAVQARRIARERDRANREAAASARVIEFMAGMFRVSNPSEARGSTVTAREVLDRASSTIEHALASEPELQARMMDTMGRVYGELGLFGKAQRLLEQAIDTRRRILGPDHPDTLASMNQLGLILIQASHPLDAEALLRETSWRQRARLGAEHPDVLRSTSSLAWALQAQGRLPEAESLYRQTLDIERRVLGPEHQGTLATMNNLGWLLQQERKLAEAEALQRETLDIQRRVFGADHPDTLASMNNLAGTLQEQRRYPEAEKLHRETLDIQRRVLGPEHRETLISMADLASTLSSSGRLAEAVTLHRATLAIQQRVLGPNHSDTAKTKYNLACALALQGEGDEALTLLRDALDHGLDNPTIALIPTDADLSALHGGPHFEALALEARQRLARVR